MHSGNNLRRPETEIRQVELTLSKYLSGFQGAQLSSTKIWNYNLVKLKKNLSTQACFTLCAR